MRVGAVAGAVQPHGHRLGGTGWTECLLTRSLRHCNTMGTASTMNALAEALGMSLPGSS